jgi:DNA-binding transcriptional LysR family regulator
MDWDDLRHFAAFVSGGSLSGAARLLAVEHATVARRIASLEMKLGLKLVDRRGRRLLLTQDGERVAAIAERMAAGEEALARLARGARSELGGEVVISAPGAYAAALLAPLVADLGDRHPALRITLLGEARTASLERREADIAIRLSRPQSGDLTTARLGEMPFRFYASPDYLRASGVDELRFIGSAGPMAGAPQQAILAKQAAGRDIGLASDQIEIQAALARAGGGVAVLPEFLAEGDERLQRVWPDETALVRDVWIVVHSDMKDAAPVRAVIDALRAGLRAGARDLIRQDAQPLT